MNLLIVTAGLSLFLGDATNSVVIAVILLVSVGLGFSNEFRAERAAETLHSRVTHTVVFLRDGTSCQIDVVDLVSGDGVRLGSGSIIPAKKNPAPILGVVSLSETANCLFMGTVVQSGSCAGAVVATGGRAEFGTTALGLGGVSAGN